MPIIINEKEKKELLEKLNYIANYDYEFDGKGVKGLIISKLQMKRVINKTFTGNWRLVVNQTSTHVIVMLKNIFTGQHLLKNSINYRDTVLDEEFYLTNENGNFKNNKQQLLQSKASFFERILIATTFNIDANESVDAKEEKAKKEFFKGEILKLEPNFAFDDESLEDLIEIKKTLTKEKTQEKFPKLKKEILELAKENGLEEVVNKQLSQIKELKSLERLKAKVIAKIETQKVIAGIESQKAIKKGDKQCHSTQLV